MRHYKKGRKLGTDKSHTKAMKRSLVSALFLNDRIKTIESRAKEIRPDVDKIIGWAKKGDLHSRRLAIAALGGDKYLVAEIFEKVAQGMFKERNSGYTRIIKLGVRKGDNARIVIIELINEGKKKVAAKPADAKASDAKKDEAKAAAKPAEKKDEKKDEKKPESKKEEKPAEKKEEKKEEPKKEEKPAEKKEETKKEEKKEEPKKEDKKEEPKKEDKKEEPKKEDKKEEPKKEENK